MSGLHHTPTFPEAPRRGDLFNNLTRAGHSCRRADAAVVLRCRLETLASQLAELDALRERVHQAEQRIEPRYAEPNAALPVSEDARALAPARLVPD